ncbi:hypothetical protein FB548_2547 [Pseudoxanthomonas sp. 3HH-4]|uniref:hypothetical protein n=1 Tax=Pseudoxanthomonas sp. 3HH-4 TaxID=1690214 RepID=UPI0011502BF4|nr:hypothetical protein [Pseudoxanthomonas sp. 3HH-4]TQM10346.1 hypothetical protein FB548_2547 [Pseudoxanthomonas sp. 3HH-4]
MIGILLDGSAPYGDRLDCAKYLGEYFDDDAERALFHVACDSAEDEDLVEDCGEALASIWLKRGSVNHELLSRLPGRVQLIAQAVLDSQKSSVVGGPTTGAIEEEA